MRMHLPVSRKAALKRPASSTRSLLRTKVSRLPRTAQEAALTNPPAQTNYTPSQGLDPFVYFSDGSSLDTTKNILTLATGSQIDITTGLSYVDPSSLIQLANGAYLDTAKNILHESDGTQIDATTGIIIGSGTTT
jgi:hypothetical protein